MYSTSVQTNLFFFPSQKRIWPSFIHHTHFHLKINKKNQKTTSEPEEIQDVPEYFVSSLLYMIQSASQPLCKPWNERRPQPVYPGEWGLGNVSHFGILHSPHLMLLKKTHILKSLPIEVSFVRITLCVKIHLTHLTVQWDNCTN